MKNRSGSTVTNVVCFFGIAAVVAILICPCMIDHPYHSTASSQCQLNMHEIGKALKMYLNDWDSYPPNRMHGFNMTSPIVLLSDQDLVDRSGKPVRYQYGINWVEAIYPYVEKVTEGDPDSVWRCPSAKAATYKAGGRYARVSYAFNANLVEMPERIVKNGGNMLMVRELDRKHDAVLRPINSTPDAKTIPQDPFLGPEDGPKIKYKLHGDGSIILFADGHVKTFPAVYFANSSGQWDSKNKQWFNYTNLPTNDYKNRSIAISP